MTEQIYTHECTSWMVFEDLTKNSTRLLHKNRDAVPRGLVPLVSSLSSPRKWIGQGDQAESGSGTIFVCSGMNESGLAAVVNSGEKSTEVSWPESDMGTPAIIESCLTHCDTVEQALVLLKDCVDSHRYSHGVKGSIFMFMDCKDAVVVEMTSRRLSVQKYNRSYAFRANIWHNPDMAAVARNDISAWLNSANREFMIMRDFNRAIDTNHRITVQDCLAAARDIESPDSSPIPRTLCSKSTNSASTYEIDLTYPDVLSTGFLLIGPPRNTICVPIPICVRKLHPAMITDFCWSAAAWKSFDQWGYDRNVPAEWTTFETAGMERYEQARNEARVFLVSGKRNEAESVLNETAYAIWDDAAKLMGLELPDSMPKK